MEVRLTPETEKKLKELSAETGRATDDILEDAMAGYVIELRQTREMLDRRYDELETGLVEPIRDTDVEEYFREKSAAARRSRLR
jgi:hypothetical protein